MANINFKNPDRDWDLVTDPKAIMALYASTPDLSKQLVKQFVKKTYLKVGSMREDGTVVLQLEVPEEFPLKKVVSYVTIKTHYETVWSIVAQKDNLLQVRPQELRIAPKDRRHKRHNVDPSKLASSNFQILQGNPDFSKITGVTAQVIIQEIHRSKLAKYTNSKFELKPSSDFLDEYELIHKNLKPIFLTDTQSMTSAPDVDCIDLKPIYEEEFLLEEKKFFFKSRKISSMLIYPVTFKFGSEPMLLGYLSLEMDKGSIPIEVFHLYREVEALLAIRIMDTNTYTVPVRQNVVNVSEGGLTLEITDKAVIESVMRRPSLVMDLNFKMQAPLRVSAEARHIHDLGASILVGFEITGWIGEDKGLEKLQSYLNILG